MKQIKTQTEIKERIVVKSTATNNVGVEQTRLTRNAIGYILKGEKYIHNDDRFTRVATGDIFFLGQGSHYIENVPTATDAFEQIVFYYTSSDLQHVIASLDSVDLTIDKKGSEIDSQCGSNVSAVTPTKIVKNFFMGVNTHFELGGFNHDHESERLKLTELAHLILQHEDIALKQRVIQSLDQEMAEFERIIYNNIFADKSIEDLARECGRSLTSFKKDFKSVFGIPPHQWYLKQKLNYAKLLVSTTSESIFQIGNICTFPNTSHFIKLFKRQHGLTPTSYRSLHKIHSNNFDSNDELKEMQKLENICTVTHNNI